MKHGRHDRGRGIPEYNVALGLGGWYLLLWVAAVVGVGSAFADRDRKLAQNAAKQPEAAGVTYHRDIAPLIHRHCATCHHEGGAGPFALTRYAEVKRRAKQIGDVTQRRLMPPWMPEAGCGDFLGDRSLTQEQIARVQRWVELGAPEGNPGGGPALTSAWREGWQLGKPDLVVTMSEPFELDAEGKDVYRNFVVPIPLTTHQSIRAVEFNPGNPRGVHHAFLFFDRTSESRRLDALDAKPGYPGIHVPRTAQAPPGHFLSWQPGKIQQTNVADVAWTLEKGSDLVIQAHLRPSGKPERIQPSVAFYFGERSAPLQPVKIGLWSYAIDIPAGDAAYVVRDSYTLPAEAELMRILPHAHFLARRIEVSAGLPDGRNVCLLRIHNWDFNWQGDYTYAQPVVLPAGTVVSMAITYDNSAENPRNPNQPPRRVKYGLQSTDEMGEAWLQLMPRSAAGAIALEKSMQPRILQASFHYNRYVLSIDPNNAKAHNDLGKSYLILGDQTSRAFQHLRLAAQLQPEYDEPHYYLGLLHRMADQIQQAQTEFQTAIRLNPGNGKAHGNLGLVLMELGDLNGALRAFDAALRIDPSDAIARESIEEIQRAKKNEAK